jgi:hypothetical protein
MPPARSLKLIEGAGRRLAVALANVEGKAAA